MIEAFDDKIRGALKKTPWDSTQSRNPSIYAQCGQRLYLLLLQNGHCNNLFAIQVCRAYGTSPDFKCFGKCSSLRRVDVDT